MGFFGRKKTDYPKMPEGGFDAVIRCSICTGEQTLCAKDRKTGELHELMLIRDPAELEGFCAANGIDPAGVEKVY